MKCGLTFFSSLIFLFTFSLSSFANQEKICDSTRENPCIVQDTKTSAPQVKYWRTTDMIAQVYQGNKTGLTLLQLSGSEAPSALAIQEIANHLRETKQKKISKLFMLDLRQETHAYLNQQAITLASEYDWINLGKTHEQTLAAEQTWLRGLTTQYYIHNVLTAAQFKSGDYSHGRTVEINNISNEQAISEKAGFHYFRLTISDHRAPRDDDTDRFVSFVKRLPEGAWVHTHCRGGKGRTTLVFTMFDMLKNADKVSLDEIIKRQASVSPYYDLTKVDRKDPALTEFYKLRLVFLTRFYQFARASLAGDQRSWSEWSRENPE